MVKSSFISKKNSLLALALVSTVITSQSVRADRLNATSYIDAHQRARNLVLAAQIPSRENNIEAGPYVSSHQHARNLMLGAQIPSLDHNIAAGTYVDSHQRARNLIQGSAESAPSALQVAR